MPLLPLSRDSQSIIRGSGKPLRCPQDAHTGLWYDRFFNRYEQTPAGGVQVPDPNRESDTSPKRDWIRTVTGPVGSRDLLLTAAIRTRRLCGHAGGKTLLLSTSGRFVTGLGLPHPVENGFSWHPTLGVPYLPGSAIKGCIRAFLKVWTEQSPSHIDSWFGNTKSIGQFIFFDALPVEPVKLEADVVTPHHAGWHNSGGHITDPEGNDCDNLPADWVSPVPSLFLAVASGSVLQFAIAPRTPEARTHLDDVCRYAAEAVALIGIGAKTAVGYGRFAPLDATQRSLELSISSKAAEFARRAVELSARARMDPNVVKIEDALKRLPKADLKHRSTDVFNAVSQSHPILSDLHRMTLLGCLRDLMKEEGVWLEPTAGERKDLEGKKVADMKKPEQKHKVRTLQVLRWLESP